MNQQRLDTDPTDTRLQAKGHIEGCVCSICRYHVPVEVAPHLLQELKSGNVAIVAGAGVSTERGSVDGPSFYRQMSAKAGAPSGAPFPAIMQTLVEMPDGRLNLIKEIRSRLDYVEFFPKLKNEATEFHRQLATLFSIRDIITTNWDTYFETYCHATPFVTAQDAALWDAADRRVLKIHGTIENYSTIVASTEDYEAAHERLSRDLIGSRLKVILSTKTILFAGYSLSDSDFQQLYRFVRDQLGPFSKQAYAITIDTSQEMADRLKELNVVPIYTDASYYLGLLKGQLEDWPCWLPDDGYDLVDELWFEVKDAWRQVHRRVDPRNYPEVIISLSYMDGMCHGLEMIREKRKTGQYSHACVIREKVHAYEELKREYLIKRLYHDVAYMEGFQNALLYRLVTADSDYAGDAKPPLFFFFGKGEEITTVKEFMATLPSLRKRHKAAYEQARRLVSSQPQSKERFHFYHRCQI